MEATTLKYLCLIFNDEWRLEAMPQQERVAFEAEHLACDDRLRESGHFIAAEALEPAHAATLVRMRNARLTITDGPFIETKEPLGGFYLVEARDLNDAIRVAGSIPSARTGSIEVRPIRNLHPLTRALETLTD